VDPARKRRIRFVVALSAAVLLAGALAYTSFSASTEAKTPSQLLAGSLQTGRTYELTGKVVAGYEQRGGTTFFRVRDRNGAESVPVRYSSQLPDPFRAGREVVVDVTKRGGVYVGTPGSLVTKCPSKFTAAPPKSKT
jgi:cytochrome c-type biogenesis protein CcmE